MLRSRQNRFLLGIALAVILLGILLIVLFSRSSNTVSIPAPKPMAAYAADPTAQVSMLIDGPVNAPSLHNQVQIIVSNTSTIMNIYSGYDDMVKANYSFPMSVAAFHVFLRSLESAGYNSGNNDPSLSQASGYCPTGDRYIFSFNVDNKQVERYWTTSCNGTHTFNGNTDLTIQLFEAQVPNYFSLTDGLNV